jgi:hypothetical protein
VESQKADDDTLLAAEAFSFGLHYPEIWKRYVNGRLGDIDRRIKERFPVSAGADWGASGGNEPGLGSPAIGDDATNASPTG